MIIHNLKHYLWKENNYLKEIPKKVRSSVMGAYGNSFTLLCDEDGEVDLSKLTEKAAEMEMKMKMKTKERIQEIENRKNIINPLLMPSCHSTNKDEAEGDDWKVHESRRRRDGSGEKGGGAASRSETVVSMKNEVKKKEGESGESEEEEEVYDGLLVEEITKGKQKMRRMVI
ncbi:hypothetical protein EZV62_004684 [Acer yangbiense]|uniref:Uncharacterized protein n=1 Tax=Acer yangbiense TaxID=1000413 RepID=A0A5C7IKY5_9ROSI|nr:hypothetical protein EZV62_004684 [Acer yangbiense]